MKLIRLLVVFGIGYVVGARAGRRRYDQIRDLATTVSEDPRVREAADRTASTVVSLVREANDRATGSGAHVADRPEDSASTAGTWPEHPDAHVPVPDDEVVYSTGPDTARR